MNTLMYSFFCFLFAGLFSVTLYEFTKRKIYITIFRVCVYIMLAAAMFAAGMEFAKVVTP
jgi:hypothetical protein